MKKLLRFVLGSSIAVLTCLLLPSVASAKEAPDPNVFIEGGQPSACEQDPTNLIVNCGFETGDFSSWIQDGDLSFTMASTRSRHTGNFGAELGPTGGLGYLSQYVPTTAGGMYFITFWLRNAGTPSEFGVYWDGNLLWRWPNSADFDYMRIAIGPVAASTGTTLLTFGFMNVPDWYFLDDIVVYPAQGGMTGCTQIMQPVAMYLGQTHKCSLGAEFSTTSTCSNSDGSAAATLSVAAQVRLVGSSWGTWSSPPEAEESFPFLGFVGGSTETITLTNAASVAGTEIENNVFMPALPVSVGFRDATGTEVARVTRDILGQSGARLFAVSCTDQVIKSMVITADPAAQGFGFAQVRSDTILGGATERPPDFQPQPVLPDATSNAQ